jgi:hypothetical protein
MTGPVPSWRALAGAAAAVVADAAPRAMAARITSIASAARRVLRPLFLFTVGYLSDFLPWLPQAERVHLVVVEHRGGASEA